MGSDRLQVAFQRSATTVAILTQFKSKKNFNAF